MAQNEFSPINKLPPEIMADISEFVAEPKTRESMFEVVKMTHVCRYWRSALISYPHLWSSIFANSGHKDFVAVCLERSQTVPLTVQLDLGDGRVNDRFGCTCIKDKQPSGIRIDERRPCQYHATISPLLKTAHIQRIRTLDVRLDPFDGLAGGGRDEDFWDALWGFKFFAIPLPALESLSFHVNHIHGLLELPNFLFSWSSSPPTKLCHLSLHGCYDGPVRVVRNLTSLEFAGNWHDFGFTTELDQRRLLPFISSNPSLVSLSLSRFTLPIRALSSEITPVRLPKLKSLMLMDMAELQGFPGLVDVPAFNTLSMLRISARKTVAAGCSETDFLVHAESDDGFQLSYNTPVVDQVVSDWLGLMGNSSPSPAFVRFEGREPGTAEKNQMASPLPLFVNAEVLEIGGPFTRHWHRNFWKDLRKVGPQLAILRLEVVEGMKPAVAKWVKKFVKARFNKGMPLAKLERMTFEERSEEDEEKAETLWQGFRAGLKIERYLAPQ